MVRDLIFSPCGGIGGPLGPLVYEYYDEGFDNRKNPNVIVQRTEGGPKGPPQSSAQWHGCTIFCFTYFVSFPESSNKTENICGNPYEANIGKSRVYKDKVIKSLLCDLLPTFGLDICSNSLILCPLWKNQRKVENFDLIKTGPILGRSCLQ